MDSHSHSQDPRTITTSGHHESNHGGVYVCRRCGWPFPNPHPSARHRRAHKRICGNVEGYKLIDSQLSFSDDEHLSDDEHKTPSPKLVKKSSSEFGSGGIGGRSNRSEDDLFSDAVMEFSDTGPSPGIEERMEDAKESVSSKGKIVDDKPITTLSDKDIAAADTPNSSTSNSQMQVHGVLESASNLLGTTVQPQDHVPQDHVKSPTINLVVSSIPDSETGELDVVASDDQSGSRCEVPVETLTTDAPEVRKSTSACEDVTECPSRSIETESDVKGDEHNLEKKLLVSPSESAWETSEGESTLEEINGNTSEGLITDEIVISKKEKSDKLEPKMSRSDISPEVETDMHKDSFVDTAPIQVNSDHDLDLPSGGDTVEGCDTKGEGTSSEHLLLVPDGIPVGNHPEIMVGGFNDHKALKLESYEAIKDEGDYDKDLVSDVSSGMHALEGGNSELVVEGVPIKEETVIHEMKESPDEKLFSDKLGALADNAQTEIEKSQQPACSLEEQVSRDFCADSSKKVLPENGTNVLSDMAPMVSPMEAEVNQSTNLTHEAQAGDHEKAMMKTDIEGEDYREAATEENHTEKGHTIPESGNHPYESQSNMKGEDVGDHEKADIKISGAAGYERMEGSREEIVTMNQESTLEFADSLSEFQVAENGIGEPVSCTETASKHFDQLSDSSRVGIDSSHLVETHSNLKNLQESTEEPEIHSSNEVKSECVGSAGPVNELNNGGDAELLQKTSENQMMKEPPLLPVEAVSLQSSVTVEDEHARVLDGSAYGIVSKSLQEQGDKSSSKQQTGASAIDVSLDSFSQTDSLEGNWGSVSDATVFSTLSLSEGIIDAEALPSAAATEGKKANTEEGHQLEKSDIYEPPSFMTLVEPRGGTDLKVAGATETQTVQNSQQSNSASSQTGWFPSLTNVTNDSQGRKKNEEIIAKVKNWSAGKQHTPLKNLLGEVSAETKQKSPNPKENPTPVDQKDGTPGKNNGPVATTVNSILGPEPPVVQAAAAKGETGKEWNSPARYPAEIKRERRKAKGKPYWVPFVCCSSVN